MPSSHFRMEEASSIATSKSGRSDVEDDFDDFVLQIDETEINNELRANVLTEDIEVVKQQNMGDEGALSQLDLTKKKILDDQHPMESENNVHSGEKNNHQPHLQTVKEVEEVKKTGQLSSSPNVLENVILIENISESKEGATDIPRNCHNDLQLNLCIGIESDTKGAKQQYHIAENINTETEEIIKGKNKCILPINGTELREVENEKVVEDAPNSINNKSDVSSSDLELKSTMDKDEKELNNIENNSSDEKKESNKDQKQSNIGEKDLNKDEEESNNNKKVFNIEEKEINKEVKELNIDDKDINNDSRVLNIEDTVESIKDENESIKDENESIKDENELDNCDDETNNYDDESNNYENRLNNYENESNNYENGSNIDENELEYENFESVDKELDSLLGEGEDSLSGRSDVTPEPMEVDVPDCLTMNHSDSMSVDSADVDDLVGSPGADDPVYSPDADDAVYSSGADDPAYSPGVNDIEDSDSYGSEENSCDTYSSRIIMHSAESLTDGSSFIFSKCKSDNEPLESHHTDNRVTDDTNQLSSENVKHTSVGEMDSTIRSQKRNKRESDSITSRKKKLKLDEEANTQETKSFKKKLGNPLDLQARKRNKNDPEFNDTELNDDIEFNESAIIENGLLGGQVSINEVKKIKEKLSWELKEIPAETMKEILDGREKLFTNYFEGKPDISINRYVLEEMIMAQLIEFITYKCEIGQLRQKCRVLESEQIRMNQMVYGLKKQVDDAKYILKRLIDEKIKNESWTQNTVPLKVTRSVGLQVCTIGPMTTRSKFSNIDNRPKIDGTVNKANLTINHSSIQTNKCSKNIPGSSENKENISTNVGSVAGNQDSNTDDVLILSVTENKKSEIPSTIQAGKKEKDTNVNINNDVNTPENYIKKITPKNGIVSNENNMKPFSYEQTNSTQVQKTETTIPQIKKTDSDITPMKKYSTLTGKSDQNASEIIDLTDKEDHQPSVKSEKSSNATSSTVRPLVNGTKISAPSTSTAIKKLGDISAGADLVNSYDHLPKYPASPKYPPNVAKPPRPVLKIGKNTSGKQGILLSWSFEGGRNPPNIEEYQLYAFQESKTPEKVKADTWKKIGDIKALPLPMACFLTQFLEGDKYHFIVRAVDSFKRLGDFSLPGSIILHAADQHPAAS